MPRKPTLTERTNADVHATFKAAVTSLGIGVDARTERVHKILVDGVAIGARLGELRNTDTPFYYKSYAEANAVAHLAVDLDLDAQGQVDVLRLTEPQPDTQLTIDGATIAFVEQTMVMDSAAHRLTLDVEAVNRALRAREEPDIVAAFAGGMLTLRFNAIPDAYYNTGFPIDDIVAEILVLTRSFNGQDRGFSRLDPSRFPLLAGLNALGSYRTKGSTINPVMTLTDHGRPHLIEGILAERLADKRRKAVGYPSACRPPWLLLNIDHHFGYNDFTSIASVVIARIRPTEYNRAIVAQTYAKPLVVDY